MNTMAEEQGLGSNLFHEPPMQHRPTRTDFYKQSGGIQHPYRFE